MADHDRPPAGPAAGPVTGPVTGPATGPVTGPAFYARSGGSRAQWWTLLHPPYTLWHLSYVVLGAALAPQPDLPALAATVAAFALAMGVGAHALDELAGRPLGTAISDRVLWVAATSSVAVAVGLGCWLALRSTPALWPLVLLGPVLVAGYNLGLFGGRLHTDAGFALSWGGFPVLVGYVAQTPPWTFPGLLAVAATAAAAVAVSAAQRRLSTAARDLRRRTAAVEATLRRTDGSTTTLDRAALLAPAEGALRALCWALPMLAAGALAARLGG